MKKILLLLLALMIVLFVSSCGKSDVAENFTWEIKDETLYIYGDGKMPDYIDENGDITERPWEEKLEEFYVVEIGEGITSIGAGAFKGCQNVLEVYIPHGVTSIGDSAFERCVSLGIIDFPGELETIGNRSFHSCYSLYELNIQNVKTIGEKAFQKCYSLSKVKIDKYIESIGAEAFTKPLYGYDIEFEGDKARWEEIGGAAATDEMVTVTCSDGSYGQETSEE